MASSAEATTMFKQVVSRLSPISNSGFIRWPQTFLLYVISHGFMLASWNALYWDDWVTYANGPEGVKDFFTACTNCVIPFRSEIESFLISPGPWFMRVLTFLFFPLIAFFFLQFLRRTTWLREDEMATLSLLMLFLPMYGARIANIDFQYSLSLLMFVLGAWMSISPRAAVRVSAAIPIFGSMFTASFQVFVVVLIAVLSIRLIDQLDKSYLDRSTLMLIVLLGPSPFVHRYLIPTLFTSLRVTDGYNTIQPAFLTRAFVVGALLMLPLLYLLNCRRLQLAIARESWQLCLGLAILAGGTFPYLAVGHFANFSDWILPFLPDESDWNSRHQLLQPFGLALILLAIAQMFGRKIKSFLAIVLITSIALNVATYSGYYLDAKKQSEVIRAMEKTVAQLSNTSALVINDQSSRFNARNREIRAYEWIAMVNRATDKNILVATNSFQFCQESKPTKVLTVTAENGRLKSLVSGTIGISISLGEVPACQFSDATAP